MSRNSALPSEREMRAAAARYEAGRKIVAELEALENRAHAAGLTMTAHGINNAKNCAGWDMAGETELAGMAARGERPGK